MRVVATKIGYMYGQLIKAGTVFNVPDKFAEAALARKKGTWFCKEADVKPEPVKILGEEEPETLSELGNLPVKRASRKSTETVI